MQMNCSIEAAFETIKNDVLNGTITQGQASVIMMALREIEANKQATQTSTQPQAEPAVANKSNETQETNQQEQDELLGVLGSEYDAMLKKLKDFDREVVNKQNDPEAMIELAQYLDSIDRTGANKSHKEYLMGVIKEFANPINNYLKDGIIKIKEDFEGKNSGMIDVKTGDIYVGVGRMDATSSLHKSALEVFVHEYIHAATVYAETVNLKEAIHAKRMIGKMYDIAKKELTAEMLVPETSIYGKEHDLQEAQELLNYVFNRTKDGKPVAYKDYHGYAEFMAHAMTNESFMNALSKLEVQYDKADAKSFTQRLHQLIKEFLDYVFNRQRSNAKIPMDKAMHKFVVEMAMANNRAQHAVKEGVMTQVVGEFNAFGEGIGQRLQKWYDKEIDEKSYPELLAQGKYLGVAKAAWKAANDPVKMDQAKKYMDEHFGKFFDQRGTIQTLIRDVQQKGTQIYRDLEGMLQLAGTIQRQKVHEEEIIIQDVNKKFKEPLTPEQKIALGHVIVETDMSQLTDVELEDLGKLVLNDNELDKTARALIRGLNVSEETKRQYETMIEGVGYFMATGNVATVGPITNTKNVIAFVEEGTTEHKQSLDKAATLFALKHTAKDARKIFAELLEKEPEGVVNTIIVQKVIRETAEEQLFAEEGNKPVSNMIQGYTRDIVDNDVDFVIAPLSEENEMLKKGYKLAQTYKAHHLDKSGVVLGGYISREAPKHPWNRSASIISDRGRRGTTLTEMHTARNFLNGYTTATVDIMNYNAHTNQALKDMKSGRYKFDPNRREMLPVLDMDGNITDYRYTMNKASKTKYLSRNARFDEMLGKTKASIIEKMWSEQNNKDIVDTLFKEYDEPESEEAQRVELDLDSNDPQIKELMKVLPKYMLEYIEDELEKRFAGNKSKKGKQKEKLTIRKDMLTLAFGYRSFGIADIADDRLTNVHIKSMLRVSEMIWKEVVKLSKNAIVIKLPIVLIQNALSNLNYMLLMGMSVSDAMKFQLDAVEGITEYIGLEKRLLELELRKGKGENVNEEIRDVKYRMKKSNVRDLFEAGLFTGIIEDVDTNKEDPNKVARKADELMEKMPEPVRVGLDWFFVTKRTPLYQWMLKSTQYSDAVAKYAMMRHYEEKMGMSKKEAIEAVRDDFVVYDMPDSKALQYLNDIGAVMFTKYITRIQRALSKGFRHNPVNFSLALVFSMLGMDFYDPTDAMAIVNKGPLDVIKLPTDHLDTLANSNILHNITGKQVF